MSKPLYTVWSCPVQWAWNKILWCFFIQFIKRSFSQNAFHSDRVGLLRDLTNEPDVMRISQMGQYMPQVGCHEKSDCMKKTILSMPIQQNKIDHERPPDAVWNPYKKNFNNHPDIKSFCKPINTPKSTVQNPYAKDAEGGGCTQHFSSSNDIHQHSSKITQTKLSNSGTHDKRDTHTLSCHNPKQLFPSITNQEVSIFIWKINMMQKKSEFNSIRQDIII